MEQAQQQIPHDLLGRELHAGNIIVHASRKSSNLYLNVGVVLSTLEGGRILWRRVESYYDRGTKRHRLALPSVIQHSERTICTDYDLEWLRWWYHLDLEEGEHEAPTAAR